MMPDPTPEERADRILKRTDFIEERPAPPGSKYSNMIVLREDVIRDAIINEIKEAEMLALVKGIEKCSPDPCTWPRNLDKQ